MSKMKFKLNRAGVSSLLKGEAMQTLLTEKASGIRGRLGAGYNQDVHVGKNRANAMVWPDTYEARRDNLKNNSLLKAVR